MEVLINIMLETEKPDAIHVAQCLFTVRSQNSHSRSAQQIGGDNASKPRSSVASTASGAERQARTFEVCSVDSFFIAVLGYVAESMKK